MSKPKRKHTRSRRDMRRAANWRLVAPKTVTCPQCGNPKLPHHICPKCGFYNKELIVIKKEKPKPEQENK